MSIQSPEIILGAWASHSRRRLSFQLARAAVVAAVSPVALMLLVLLHGASVTVAMLLTVWAACWLLVPVLVFGSLFAGRARALPGRGAAFDPKNIVLGEAKPIPRRSVLGALLLHDAGGATIELSLRNGSVLHIITETEQDALRLLSLVDVKRAGRTVAHEVGSSSPAMQTATALAFGVLISGLALCALAFAGMTSPSFSDLLMFRLIGATFIAATLYAAARRGPLRIVIGADGVVLEGTRRRFIPYSKIDAIMPSPNRVILVTSAAFFGKRVVLTRERGPRTDALVHELGVAMERARAGTGNVTNLALLDRGHRTLSQWREQLRRLATTHGDYRRAGLEREILVETAGDVGAPQARRIAAAFALSHTKDEQAIQRVRIAVKSLANERARSALAAALDGELNDEALAEALAQDERASPAT